MLSKTCYSYLKPKKPLLVTVCVCLSNVECQPSQTQRANFPQNKIQNMKIFKQRGNLSIFKTQEATSSTVPVNSLCVSFKYRVPATGNPEGFFFANQKSKTCRFLSKKATFPVKFLNSCNILTLMSPKRLCPLIPYVP